ncbi:hypothetical protein KAU32_07375 [bacterium]|nr:hypothetical protein [bacterium]
MKKKIIILTILVATILLIAFVFIIAPDITMYSPGYNQFYTARDLLDEFVIQIAREEINNGINYNDKELNFMKNILLLGRSNRQVKMNLHFSDRVLIAGLEVDTLTCSQSDTFSFSIEKYKKGILLLE